LKIEFPSKINKTIKGAGRFLVYENILESQFMPKINNILKMIFDSYNYNVNIQNISSDNFICNSKNLNF
jgi:hypothetical protein